MKSCSLIFAHRLLFGGQPVDKTVIFTVFSGFGGQIRVYNKTRKALILRVFHSLFNCDCTSDGGADHGVVAHTDETHHLNVCGD